MVGTWLRGTSIPGCCTVWKAKKNPFPASLPPSLPLPLQGSEKQLEGTGWWEKLQDTHVDPGKRRGWGINMARGGVFVRCRQGLTLPLDVLHAGTFPRDSCHPSMPLGSGLGYTFTSLSFPVTFLRAFAIERRRCRALHRWEAAALHGEVPFPKKTGLVVGFAAGFAVVELTAVSSVPSPAVFESSGAAEPSLHCCTRALCASRGSQAAPSDDLQDLLELVLPHPQSSLMKGPWCLHHCSTFPPVQREFLFACRSPIIGVGEEVGRSCIVLTPGRALGAAVTWTEPWGQGPPSPKGCGKELPPLSGCSSSHFQCCRELSRLIKGFWANYQGTSQQENGQIGQ